MLEKKKTHKTNQEELRTDILHKFSYPLDQLLYLKFNEKPEKRGDSLKHTGDTAATAQDTTLLDLNQSRGGDVSNLS